MKALLQPVLKGLAKLASGDYITPPHLGSLVFLTKSIFRLGKNKFIKPIPPQLIMERKNRFIIYLNNF